VKPAHAVRLGDALLIRIGEIEWNVVIRGLDERRGPAERARTLYEESESGRVARERVQDQRRWGTEPSLQLKGRPTKRDRRRLERFSRGDGD
jgi:ribosome-associated heat shock protein Hsp15